MTPSSRAPLSSSLLVAILSFVAPPVGAQVPPSDGAAPAGAEPQRMAQNSDTLSKKEQIEAARAKKIKDKQDAAKAAQAAKKAQAEAAKANAVKAKQDAQNARLKAIKDKQDGAKAAQAAKKAQADAAQEKARKAQQDSQAARAKAIKDKQDAAKAAQASKKEQIEAARAKAIRDRQEADAARRKAIKDRQDAVRVAPQPSKKEQIEADRNANRPPAKYDRANADLEFERARKRAQDKSGGPRGEKWTPSAANKFEALRNKRTTRQAGSRNIIIEPDRRVIVRNDDRVYIRHDDGARFARKGHRELRRERRKDGLLTVVTMGVAGALIYSLMDDEGRVVRRSRRDRDGREYVFFDNRRSYSHRPGYFGPGAYRESYIDLPPPVVRIPRDRYIVDYDRASPDDLYDTLSAPPIERLDRGYTLDEVRQNYPILERMRRVDLDTINFEFASWEVTPDQYPTLERLARAIQRVIDRSPGELFMIEGHTDAVGDDVDNLSLSDRRAEAVAIILTDNFGIPPENLTTQGYGEEYLKEQTDGPSWINRRVSVRRVTPLLSREGWDAPE
ncbi:OmpA family protein [uncultured Hyphomicrobium sp.]|uniref:OmpA family protein n=1 Tax=uncultured Hyphomicrobium sp. TaxID=194373 RepID=UPI0025D3F0D3|nr:OmpA family protein [uncultured Hyphomicrobium sp.]